MSDRRRLTVRRRATPGATPLAGLVALIVGAALGAATAPSPVVRLPEFPAVWAGAVFN